MYIYIRTNTYIHTYVYKFLFVLYLYVCLLHITLKFITLNPRSEDIWYLKRQVQYSTVQYSTVQYGTAVCLVVCVWTQNVGGGFCIKTQSVPRSKHTPSLRTSQLILYREIMAVCSEIHTKHINTVCGQNVEMLNVKLAVHIVTTGL